MPSGETTRSDAPPGSLRSTIVFVDLSLFSSFTYLEGDEAAVEVVDRFDRAVRQFCVLHNGRVKRFRNRQSGHSCSKRRRGRPSVGRGMCYIVNAARAVRRLLAQDRVGRD